MDRLAGTASPPPLLAVRVRGGRSTKMQGLTFEVAHFVQLHFLSRKRKGVSGLHE